MQLNPTTISLAGKYLHIVTVVESKLLTLKQSESSNLNQSNATQIPSKTTDNGIIHPMRNDDVNV